MVGFLNRSSIAVPFGLPLSLDLNFSPLAEIHLVPSSVPRPWRLSITSHPPFLAPGGIQPRSTSRSSLIASLFAPKLPSADLLNTEGPSNGAT